MAADVSDHYESFLHRLGRAREYIESFDREAQRWVEGGCYTLILEGEPKERPSLKVAEVKRCPPEFGGLVGDAVHNMRSGLDHLAFALVVANHGRRRVPRDIETSSEFPIFNSGTKFTNGGYKKLVGMRSDVQAAVERLQPYHRRKCPENRVLWTLYLLSNSDKHRAPWLTIATLLDSRITVTVDGVTINQEIVYRGRLKRGAVIAQWEVDHFAAESRMDVDPNLKVGVAFGKGLSPPFELAPRTLANIWECINNRVRPELESYL